MKNPTKEKNHGEREELFHYEGELKYYKIAQSFLLFSLREQLAMRLKTVMLSNCVEVVPLGFPGYSFLFVVATLWLFILICYGFMLCLTVCGPSM